MNVKGQLLECDIIKKIENVDIVAAILASSIIDKLEAETTPAGDKHTQPLIPKSVRIFKDIKRELEK